MKYPYLMGCKVNLNLAFAFASVVNCDQDEMVVIVCMVNGHEEKQQHSFKKRLYYALHLHHYHNQNVWIVNKWVRDEILYEPTARVRYTMVDEHLLFLINIVVEGKYVYVCIIYCVVFPFYWIRLSSFCKNNKQDYCNEKIKGFIILLKDHTYT